jgi:hypothetical protein
MQTTNGSAEYKHVTGEISIVRIEPPGVVMRRIRIENLPPETPERTLRTALAPNGNIVTIQDEICSNAYRYRVPNGIKVIMMKKNKHLPSKMNIAVHNGLVFYEGQPVTCYGCGHSGHMYEACPERRRGEMKSTEPTTSTWAQNCSQRIT